MEITLDTLQLLVFIPHDNISHILIHFEIVNSAQFNLFLTLVLGSLKESTLFLLHVLKY